MTIRIDGIYFKDADGRTRLLRGVNLSGTSKIPYTPDGATHIREGFFDHRNVSFVGRPFPLAQADQHFERLRTWGLTFLRMVVPWEAIEHAGAGIYDHAYLDYLEAVIDKAGEYGFELFIDPHQDVWSRFTGGDGAPGWTLEAVGLEMQHFQVTGAALVHQMYGDPFPKMHWATNYSKLAAATMFTLFFAGNDFAPDLQIEGIPVQDYLQRHYFDAFRQVARRLRGKLHVVGYDSLNEPSNGLIGLRDLGKLEWRLRTGDMPTPFQSMLLGAGYAQQVEVWRLSLLGLQRIGRRIIDPRGVQAWKDGQCIWKAHGVWDTDDTGAPRLLQPDYFAARNGRPVDFQRDYLRPFINQYAQEIRAEDPDAIIFIEFDASSAEQTPIWGASDAQQIVYAPHWYDFLTLMAKQYWGWIGIDALNTRPVLGRSNLRAAHAADLAHDLRMAKTRLGGVPTLIGEIGVPYDLNEKSAYLSGQWQSQLHAIDDAMQALEVNLLSATLWNYSPDNTNARGDQWNGEDLSIFSEDQRESVTDIHSGGRALQAVVRPYARATSGEPLRMRFSVESAVFEYSFRHDPAILAPTELYVPNLQYPDGYRVTISSGRYELDQQAQQVRYYADGSGGTHHIRIEPLIPKAVSRSQRGWQFAVLLMLIAALIRLLTRKR
jgi:hypothetical protein